jgi:hypothetical protein
MLVSVDSSSVMHGTTTTVLFSCWSRISPKAEQIAKHLLLPAPGSWLRSQVNCALAVQCVIRRQTDAP